MADGKTYHEALSNAEQIIEEAKGSGIKRIHKLTGRAAQWSGCGGRANATGSVQHSSGEALVHQLLIKKDAFGRHRFGGRL